MLSVFREAYPAVSYDFYAANADDSKERLDKGLLDIGLLAEPVDISKYSFIRLKGNGLISKPIRDGSAERVPNEGKPAQRIRFKISRVRIPISRPVMTPDIRSTGV